MRRSIRRFSHGRKSIAEPHYKASGVGAAAESSITAADLAELRAQENELLCRIDKGNKLNTRNARQTYQDAIRRKQTKAVQMVKA